MPASCVAEDWLSSPLTVDRLSELGLAAGDFEPGLRDIGLDEEDGRGIVDAFAHCGFDARALLMIVERPDVGAAPGQDICIRSVDNRTARCHLGRRLVSGIPPPTPAP